MGAVCMWHIGHVKQLLERGDHMRCELRLCVRGLRDMRSHVPLRSRILH